MGPMMENLMTKKLLALALAAAIVLPVAAYADDAAPQRRIVVLGEGQATVKPDMALLSLSVMREAMSAREALDANNKAMAEVIAAMKASGVADRDLQTAGVQISPRYDYINKPDGTQEAKLAAYQVTNTLSVRARPRQDRRDPRQVGHPRRQPGRRRQLHQ